MKKLSVMFLSVLLLLSVFIPVFGAGRRGIGVMALKSRKGNFKTLKAYDNIYALVIGIDKFSSLSGNQQLEYCVKDAKGVRNTLRSYYKFKKIEELYDRDATRSGILAKFQQMSRFIGKNDALFVFIASHGISDNDVGFILPHDGSFSEFYKNISMNDLRDVVGKIIRAKHIFYVIDACYSGSILRQRGGEAKNDASFEYIKQMTKEPVRYALTAGDKGQTVLDGGPGGHSVFTGRFIEALKDADGFITGSELSTKISRKVFSDARDRRHKQTPQYGRLSGLGDFVLIKKGGKRLDGVNADLKRIQLEKKKLESQFRNARNKQARELARLALQRKRAEEKRKKLEQSQLKLGEQRKAADRIRAARLQKDYLANRKRQQAQLERVKQQVAARRKQMEALDGGADTAAGFLKKLGAIQRTIGGVKRSYDSSRNRELNKVQRYYRSRHNRVARLKSGMFESHKEFARRKKIETDTLGQNEDNEKRKINTRYTDEKRKALKGLLRQQQALSVKNIFTAPKIRVKLHFAIFDKRRLAFPIQISCRYDGFIWNKTYYHKIIAENLSERRLKGMKILNKIKAGAYKAELRYYLDMKTKRRVFFSLTIIDITENGSVLLEYSPARSAYLAQLKIKGTSREKRDSWKKFVRQDNLGKYKAKGISRIYFWHSKYQDEQFKLKQLKLKKMKLKQMKLKQMKTAGMVFVKGGSFNMGNIYNDGGMMHKRVHRVKVFSFWMGKYEVTQKEYRRVMRRNPSKHRRRSRPVENVSFYDAVKYCNKRSRMEGLAPCYGIYDKNVSWNKKANGYRLPTEAEWEYAGRGGFSGVGSQFKYAGSNSLEAVGWYNDNSGSKTHPVGEKTPNQLGLYDMSGNVHEWCWTIDWADGRMAKGGHYWNSPSMMRLGDNQSFGMSYFNVNLGFRIVRNR